MFVVKVVSSMVLGGLGGFILGLILFSVIPSTSDEPTGYSTLFGVLFGLITLLIYEVNLIHKTLKKN
ncbi:hypothetical protein [Pseudalkalibacillus sp. SCS-8]|uniref:hypothetical protein n=1 Tax=Pseudalkalibacillus nanhaiensis TaxID=3115291 RepID=UPI0032DA9B50